MKLKTLFLIFTLSLYSACSGLGFNSTSRSLASVKEKSCNDVISNLLASNHQKISKLKTNGRPIILVTDTSLEMSNGVVTVVKKMTDELEELGVPFKFISPENVPGYVIKNEKAQGTGIHYLSQKKLREILKKENPIAIHLVTEGMIGESVKNYALQEGIPFSTFYHTAWPEFFHEMFNIPVSLGEKYVSRFHKSADTVMSATDSMVKRLKEMGIPQDKLKIRSHGVDIDHFHPRDRADFIPEVKEIFENNEGPFSLFVGRISPEKNIGDFLDADIDGTKIIVGDGPLLQEYLAAQKNGQYKNVIFTGRQGGEKLAQFYAGSDVFVFPSRSDTFGLVQLEAMASGTPVAGYPVQGPIDVVTKKTGGLNENLELAIKEALTKNRKEVREYAQNYSWKHTALQFIEYVHEIPEQKIDNLGAKMPIYQKIPLITTSGGIVYAIIYSMSDED
ncbi:glycosyltransferase [Halobacteriovorax sp. HLS]|uniref:glycosyltransferase n=1 Tax=Halobacteriovorax sp. HLS TaxID=2234000 RepID=UPI000FD818CC|nr:glycosyltransferase [Halobacteriovorax sp. HLS]